MFLFFFDKPLRIVVKLGLYIYFALIASISNKIFFGVNFVSGYTALLFQLVFIELLLQR
ncbi:MAG: hypothetical protein CM15mP65_18140 [Crocinitomicaceae bacterium]|nr:MAG: hypothetical protein CM15mP65_18140 [Crocinitomicaceae bacterium]